MAEHQNSDNPAPVDLYSLLEFDSPLQGLKREYYKTQ